MAPYTQLPLLTPISQWRQSCINVNGTQRCRGKPLCDKDPREAETHTEAMRELIDNWTEIGYHKRFSKAYKLAELSTCKGCSADPEDTRRIADVILDQRYEMEGFLYPHLLESDGLAASKNGNHQNEASITPSLAAHSVLESSRANLRSDKASKLRMGRAYWENEKAQRRDRQTKAAARAEDRKNAVEDGRNSPTENERPDSDREGGNENANDATKRPRSPQQVLFWCLLIALILVRLGLLFKRYSGVRQIDLLSHSGTSESYAMFSRSVESTSHCR